ncbi:hypothetical protein R1sor_001717 [Riccia sorocarpa]|uniref:F-box domain-containing protein n=1 Tax=Riccia sorocarpa TaxID=122646 RepID=A0ABD3H050_9MARC
MASGNFTTLSVSKTIRRCVERWSIKKDYFPVLLQEETNSNENREYWPDSADPNYLDPVIWKNLPEELLDYIRSKLPFNSLVTFLTVSRSWMSAIESSNSSRENGKRRSRGVVLQLCSDPITAYNSSKWELFPKLPGPEGTRQVVASEGGLLCMRSSTERELVVWNPLTKRVRHLQIPIVECGPHNDVIKRISRLDKKDMYRFYQIGMVYNSRENSYHVIVAVVENRVPGITLVYNSSTRTWKRVQEVPPGYFFFLNTVSTENSFFCGLIGDERMLLEYDVQLQTWKTTVIPVTNSSPTSFIKLDDIFPSKVVQAVLTASSMAPKGSMTEVKCITQGDIVYFLALTMENPTSLFRLRRGTTFMRIWSHRVNDADVFDSLWSCIGYTADDIDWASSCQMLRSDYSRLSSLVVVPSLIGQP